MPDTSETSRYYKLPYTDINRLKSILNSDEYSLWAGCNVYVPDDKTNDIYIWAWTSKLSLFDKIEDELLLEEVGLEEIKKVDEDPTYKKRNDIPYD